MAKSEEVKQPHFSNWEKWWLIFFITQKIILSASDFIMELS